MLEVYQNLPEQINPVAVSIGFFSIRWYSLSYLVGFLTVYVLLRYRVKRGEFNVSNFLASESKISNKSQITNLGPQKFLANLFLYIIIGLLIGARLGYVVFYNPSYYLLHPLEIFLPVQFTDWGPQITGIFGMSYFGGLAGVLISGWLFSKKNGLNFLKLSDFVVPAAPAGYFFGRVGNFLNGELYGRITDGPWGMYFSSDLAETLRHPSQLYEAFLEGIVLFLILWPIRNKIFFPGRLLTFYLLGYGIFRFLVEFLREPDWQIGFAWSSLTLGQVFSFVLIIFSVIIYAQKQRQNRSI